MNHSSNLLERISPRPTPCPLVRLGHNNSSTDDTNNSTDGGDKYQPFQFQQYTRQNPRLFHNAHQSIAGAYLQKQHGSSEESDYLVRMQFKYVRLHNTRK